MFKVQVYNRLSKKIIFFAPVKENLPNVKMPTISIFEVLSGLWARRIEMMPWMLLQCSDSTAQPMRSSCL